MEVAVAKILPFEGNKHSPSDNILRKVSRRPKSAEVRAREYLTPDEVTSLMKSASTIGRHRHRDKTLILLMYRHGLRVTEAVDLRWDQVNLSSGQIHINRLKNGKPSTHYLEGNEMRALRHLQWTLHIRY